MGADEKLLKGLSRESEPSSDEQAEVSEIKADDLRQQQIDRFKETIKDLQQDRE